jgi:hypothetical protein
MRIAKCETKRLFELFDLADDLIEVGPITGIEFGMEQFAIGANLESAAARWDERKRLDAFAEFKNLGRQTDGLRRVVSNDAIFDRDFRLHSVSSFPSENPTGWTKPVKRSDRGGESDAQQAVRISPKLQRTHTERRSPKLFGLEDSLPITGRSWRFAAGLAAGSAPAKVV